MKRPLALVLFIGVVVTASLAIRYDEHLKGNPVLGEWSFDCHSPVSRHLSLILLDNRRCILRGETACQHVSYDVNGDVVSIFESDGTLIEEVTILENHEPPHIDNGTTGTIIVVAPSGSGLVDGKELTDAGEQTVYQSCQSSMNHLFLWEFMCLTSPGQHCPES